MRRYRHFFRRRGAARFITILASVFAALIVILLVCEARINPLIRQMAYQRVNYLASKAINDAIDDEVSGGKIQYDDMISFEKNSEGQITALKTNMVKINQLKVEVSNIVLDRIDQIDQSQLNIPLGNIINGDLLSGRGPKIPVKIIPLGTVRAAFSNQFSTAGINQTRHQIIMEITVNMNVLTPGWNGEVGVSTQVSVAETVIVGTVPGSYTYFEESSDSTQKSDILDGTK